MWQRSESSKTSRYAVRVTAARGRYLHGILVEEDCVAVCGRVGDVPRPQLGSHEVRVVAEHALDALHHPRLRALDHCTSSTEKVEEAK